MQTSFSMPHRKLTTFSRLDEMFTNFGYNWHTPDYFISPDEPLHTHVLGTPYRADFYGLALCVEGWLDLTINYKPVRIEPLSFFAISPFSILERGEQSPDCKGRLLFFSKDFLLTNLINERQLEAFRFFAGSPSTLIHLTRDEADPLLSLYDVLKKKRDNHNTPYHIDIVRSLFFAYLYESAAIYKNNNLPIDARFTRELDLNFKFQQLVSQHARQEHHLQFYADALFITPKYLIQAVKKSSGQTPGQWIDAAIIEMAKSYLKSAHSSIASIAESLHFSDQASFSKFFKKHTGASPTFFRNSQ
ncbi:helix-turn-helix domain-containing protein [Spirosoma litoris]